MEEFIDLLAVQEEKKKDEIEFPENGTSLDLLQAIYRNPSLPLSTRRAAARDAIPYEYPKLAVTAVVNEGDFADQLERAIQASRKIIEAKLLSVSSDVSSDDSDTKLLVQPSNGHKPSVPDRRYRRW